jgi:hypothetical protein
MIECQTCLRIIERHRTKRKFADTIEELKQLAASLWQIEQDVARLKQQVARTLANVKPTDVRPRKTKR